MTIEKSWPNFVIRMLKPILRLYCVRFIFLVSILLGPWIQGVESQAFKPIYQNIGLEEGLPSLETYSSIRD